MSNADDTPEAPHPSDEEFVAWMGGGLDDAEAGLLEDHLEACERCALRLDELEAAPDPFLDRLRRASGVGEASAPAAADDNLMFGALALQEGHITPEQLADACRLWPTSNKRSLAELMIDQGWLDEASRMAVAALAVKQAPKPARRSAQETLSGRDSGGGLIGETLLPSGGSGGRLRLKELYSVGGIGQVWRAHDTVLGREVALKELLPELRGSKQHRERFYREARVAAQLAHPGTAPVHEYREEGGRCYYTMKFYRGRTFSEAIQAAHRGAERDEDRADQAPGIAPHRLSELLEQFLTVCDTIAYAHAQGIVHRDLKGENIVLGEYGEVTVIDWGIAKSLSAASDPPADSPRSPDQPQRDSLVTLEGERLGTPGYMAPEQARGDLSAIDHRTDVYGLAAVLYELLTTRPPFSGATANEVMHRVEVDEPAPPSLTHPSTPPALEAICLRGLAKAPQDRQQSAIELRDAVRKWLNDLVRHKREADRQAKFFALSQDLFVAFDDRGGITQMNPAFKEFFGGLDGDKAMGKSYLAGIHPDDVPLMKSAFGSALSGIAQPDFVLRVAGVRSRSGYHRVRWTLTRVPGGRTLYAVGRPDDDEAQRRRRTEERNRFFSLSSDLCLTFDAGGRVCQANRAWVDTIGITEEQAIGRDCLEGVHPDDVENVRSHLDAVRGGKSARDIVARSAAADGRHVAINWTLTRVAGEDLVYAIGRVIDPERERRRALESRARFFALSPDLFVISDDRGVAGQINEAWTRMLGWTPDEVLGRPFAEFVHPDDVGYATRAGRRALLREPVVNLETRVRTKGGDYRMIAWTLCRVAGGRVNYAIGRDVTEDRLAQERLRAILNAGPEALVVVGVDSRIEYANRTLCRLFGYPPGEIEGRPLEVLIPPDFRERHAAIFDDYLAQPMVRSMGRGAPFPGIRRDGSRLMVQVSLSPLMLSGGRMSILAAVLPRYDLAEPSGE